MTADNSAGCGVADGNGTPLQCSFPRNRVPESDTSCPEVQCIPLIQEHFIDGAALAIERAAMFKDFRQALRSLRQNPGFALAAIISIALAIGVNAAAFSFVDTLVFRPLPVRDAGRVVSLRMISPSATATAMANTGTDLSYPDYVNFRDNSRSFDGLIAYGLKSAGFAMDAHTQARLKLAYVVSGNFFQVLGADPTVGRAFRPDEDEVPGRDAVVVLANDFWKQEFAGNPSVVGTQIRL